MNDVPGELQGEKRATDSRLPALDGLRAISIVLVILGHLSGAHGFITLNMGIGDYAHLGVVVFFVISGFLITTLLLAEERIHGRVSLKLFYARRSLRIFPAAFAYLAVVGMLWTGGVIHLKTSDMMCAITYTMNYLPERSWQVGHLWSLSVEEQFYLVWPFAFAHLRPRNRVGTLAGVLLVAVLARLAARLFLEGTAYRNLEMFPMVADSLAAGCLLGIARGWLESQSWYLRLLRPLPSILIFLCVLVLNRYGAYTIDGVLGSTLINLGLAMLIHRCVLYSKGGFSQFLQRKPVAFVGVLSYSLYLWQQLFLNRNSGTWTNAFPQNLVFAVVAAAASYFLLEKPLMRFRTRLRMRSIACDSSLCVLAPIPR
jgi:peptidoglycan/LPS O-acetylase OafA/YrhL